MPAFFWWVVLLLLALPAAASNDGWLQFERSQHAIRQFNFDLTYVQVRFVIRPLPNNLANRYNRMIKFM